MDAIYRRRIQYENGYSQNKAIDNVIDDFRNNRIARMKLAAEPKIPKFPEQKELDSEFIQVVRGFHKNLIKLEEKYQELEKTNKINDLRYNTVINELIRSTSAIIKNSAYSLDK